ncbi:MAG TPA: HepT-like ribonuclease domain-containing protein [Thermosynechococcaceae cyanobacterium]
MTDDGDRVYLEHILECTTLIRDYTRNSKTEFMTSSLVRDAVLRRLQTMAESTQCLSDDLKAQTPEVDWQALAGFRSVLVHDYLGGIDLERVWDAIEHYLPGLETTVREMREAG